MLATSSAGTTSSANFSVNLTDVNAAPGGAGTDVNAAGNQVAETATTGTAVGRTAQAVAAVGMTESVLTLVYALEALVVYTKLYGKKSSPFETHEGHVHTIGQTVKSCVYGCILCVVFFSFIFTVDLLDQKRWVPFAQSVCLVISTLLCFMGLTAPPREPEVDELGSSPVR